MSVKYENKLTQIRGSIANLLKSITHSSQISLDAFEKKDMGLFLEAQEKLSHVEAQGNLIDNEIIKTFALYGPEANELRTLVAYLKMINEIVRIGVGFKKYARRMSEHCQSGCHFDNIAKTIVKLNKSTINSLVYILECFENFDACIVEDFYRKVLVEESINDDLFSIIEKEIMTIIIDAKELSVEYVKVLATLRKLERSCDRSVNIANLLVYAKNGGEFQLYN